MNLPNKLTISRFVLTVAFLAVMFSGMPYHETIALALFCAGGISDFLDGQIARRRKLITNFGILMDPLADKILTCSAFIALVERSKFNPDTGALPAVSVEAWMVVLIVARELAITGLRLLASSKGVTMAAERYGKHKTISQIVAIIALLVLDAHVEWWPWLRDIFGRLMPWFPEVALWVTVILTFTSGALYLWRNRQIYLEDM